MDRSRTLAVSLLCLATCWSGAQNLSNPGNSRSAAKETAADDSHSHFGTAFDQGPRRLALLNPGAGPVRFPVTTAVPMAQAFFDQGLNLVYSFQWVEAERAFRQALRLDPECAMAYWGLAMSDSARAKAFIEMAQKREAGITDREVRYIEALALQFSTKDRDERMEENRAALADLMKAYPDDLDAKAIYAWTLPKRNPETMDKLLMEVLAIQPLHPGANHYRIHLWDEVPDPQRALDSADKFTLAAPNVGHAQHMPGHIYASSGLWTKAVDAMDRGTRVERKFMAQYGFLPHESWNYPHNQDYLISNLGYVGRITEGFELAKELMDVPRDPKGNNGSGFSVAGTGRFDCMRMMVRGERWDAILAAARDEASEDLPSQKSWRQYAQAMAHLGKGELDAARVIVKEIDEGTLSGDVNKCALYEVRGRLAVLDGRTDEGLTDLREAAKIEKEKFTSNDPPRYPRPLYESLAWGLAQADKWVEAEEVLATALKKEPENGFALVQHAEALAHLGRRDDAERVLAELGRVWRYADADLPALARLKVACTGAGLTVPAPVRYRADALRESFGPARWTPLAAPAFNLQDTKGARVRLSRFKGSYLVLIFYLGGECEHCVEQLKVFGEAQSKFVEAGVSVLAVTPEAWNGAPQTLAANPVMPRIVSDPDGKVALAYGARDEFENLPLHATLIIDRQGKIWWRTVGSEPFTDTKFVLGEIARLEAKRTKG